MLQTLHTALHWLALQALPLRCMVCEDPGAAGLDLCAACHAALPWNDHACVSCALPLPADAFVQCCSACLREPPRQRAAVAAFVYAPPIDQLLRRFKFHQDLAAGRLLSQLMLQRVPVFVDGASLQPVPLHWRRLRARGYDQVLELAKPLAKALQVPLWQGLRRTRLTTPQSDLDAEARLRNPHGAFHAVLPPPPQLVLMDDVMTTGATLGAALQAVQQAGPVEGRLWVCARAP